MTKQPNVLFILSDQHNAKVMAHQGHPDVQTPNFDRLAAEGVRFDTAITQNPICTPSRMSWYSGQYCHNHGYYGLNGPNPNGLPTIFGHFRKAGYRTGAIGKIHCPEYWVEDDCDVFHEVCPGCSIGGRSRKYTAYLEERELAELEDHHPSQNPFMDGKASGLPFEHSCEGWGASESIEFMKASIDAGERFFLAYCPPKPHSPYTPSKEFWDLYDEAKITLPPNADYDMTNKAPHLRAMAEHWRNGGWLRFEPKTFEAGRRRKLRGYLGSVSHVDHAAGELINWIDQNGLAEDTIVIYSSDHGDYACEHGQMEKAPGICSDAITRVPMIWRWPGRFKAGHVANEIVETVDLTTTLCSLAGLDLMETSDGKDISHLLRGESGAVHRVGVTEFAWSKSVRKGKWRLVYYPPEFFAEEHPDGFGELYDLEADPWELKNLYFDAGHAEIVSELESDLLRWLVTTTRPATATSFPSPHPDQVVQRYHKSANADGKISPQRLNIRAGKNYL